MWVYQVIASCYPRGQLLKALKNRWGKWRIAWNHNGLFPFLFHSRVKGWALVWIGQSSICKFYRCQTHVWKTQYIKSNQGVRRFVIGKFHFFTIGKPSVYICFEGIHVIMCMMLWPRRGEVSIFWHYYCLDGWKNTPQWITDTSELVRQKRTLLWFLHQSH